MPLTIRGVGLRTAAGAGLAALHAALAEGRSALGPIPHSVARGLPHALGGRVPGLEPGPERGRALASSAIAAALEGCSPQERARTPLLVGTGLGPQEPREEDEAAPRAHALTRELAREHGLDVGRSLTYSVTCVSGLCALERARAEVARGAPGALVLGIETLSRTIQGGFCALEALSRTATPGGPAPQDGIVLGEAACAIHLGGGPRGRTGQRALLAQRLVADATHITSPDPEGRGMREAVAGALADAGVAPRDLGWIALTASSSPVYSETYARALEGLVPDWRARVVDWEPAVGHLLAASGPLGVVFTPPGGEGQLGLALTVGFGGLNGATLVGPSLGTAEGRGPSRATRIVASARASEGAPDLEDDFAGRWDPRRRIPTSIAPLVEATRRALRAAGWWTSGQTLPDLAVVVAVDDHAEADARRFREALAKDRRCSPAVFLNSLPSTPATNLSLLLGARGQQATINSGGEGGAAALEEARTWIATGRAERVVAAALSADSAGAWRLACVALLEAGEEEAGAEEAGAEEAEKEGPSDLPEAPEGSAASSFTETLRRPR